MNKKIFEKVLSGGILDVKDLTPDEKKVLYAHFEALGLPSSTAQRRFFDKGFSLWEIKGVSHIKDEFLTQTACCTDDKGTEEEGTRGYGYVLTLDSNYDDSKFYDLCTNLKIGNKLCDLMATLGMASQMTVRTRFKANDWKPWELKGVAEIINSLYADETETEGTSTLPATHQA